MINYPVITLCGSTHDRDLWTSAKKQLTLAGSVVISVGFFGHCEGLDMASKTKIFMDKLHFERIMISDGIYVLNRKDRIGLSTCDEIMFAMTQGKIIWFYNPIPYSEDIIYDLLKPNGYTATYSSTSGKITGFIPAEYTPMERRMIIFFQVFDHNERRNVSEEAQVNKPEPEVNDQRLVLDEQALRDNIGFAVVSDFMSVILNADKNSSVFKHILYALNTLIEINKWQHLRVKDLLLVQMLIIHGLAHIGCRWLLLTEREMDIKISNAVRDEKDSAMDQSEIKKTIINNGMTWENDEYKYLVHLAVDCINSVVLYKDFFDENGLFEQIINAALRSICVTHKEFIVYTCRHFYSLRFTCSKLKHIHATVRGQDIIAVIKRIIESNQ